MPSPLVPLLQVNSLQIEFETPQGKVKAVDNISFHLNKGETVAVVGESGSGKSVTGLALMQLLQSPPECVSSGSAVFQSRQFGPIDLLSLPEKQMQKVRGQDVSIIFQESLSALNPVMRCGKQIAEALRIHLPLSKKQAYACALELLELVQLPHPEKMYQRYPHQLSGGQKQRIMIAMAVACGPDLLIADEPTTALDVTVQAGILRLLNQLRLQNQMAMLFISHDLSVVAELADKILVMYEGKIVEQGSVADIFTHPQHPYTKALLACLPNVSSQKKVLPEVADFLKEEQKNCPRSSVQLNIESLSSTVDKVRNSGSSPGTSSSLHPLLEVQDIHVDFTVLSGAVFQKKEVISALKGISFAVFPGETIGIVGESGCGKTTLGRALVQLIKPSSGHVVFNGKNWATLPKEELRKERKHFQIIFQDSYAALNPTTSIGEAIMEPMQAHGMFKDRRERKQRALALLETVGLLPEHFNRYPQDFSGGQLQRICLARALALEPTCIICDEIVSALDVSVQAQILNLLNRLKHQFNLTILFITHDLAVAKFLADRLLVMEKGQIIEQGPTEEIFTNPQQAYTAALLKAIPTGEIADILAVQEKRKAHRASIDE